MTASVTVSFAVASTTLSLSMAVSLQFCRLCIRPVVMDSDFDAKMFRKNLTRSDNYNRVWSQRGDSQAHESRAHHCSVFDNLMFGLRIEFGDILETLKTNGYTYSWGDVTVKVAKAYGFCWGVERAVQIAYEPRRQFLVAERQFRFLSFISIFTGVI
ncbi:hypothetical protein Bca52824_034927 [Brassica carinata]|uniref:Uncharacterized protein n=1 Tax=Brassica carinata TaxID=52824 RepID=A0A8X7V024_BRACI|nr:hypothetical protein Bca52824_034927 [Brassica carinata]